jgi:Spx/MgsR family transcriptional regulator
MAITLYGIPHCDTVKKARAFLNAQGLAYTFHHVKRQGVTPELIDHWLREVSWNQLLNRAGTTFKRLGDAERAGVVDAASARAVLAAHPSAIKRTVVRWPDGALTVGFDPAVFASRVQANVDRRGRTT